MARRLTGEERALWDRLRKSVRPLHSARTKTPAAPTEAHAAPARQAPKPLPARSAPKPKALAPLASRDERAHRRLARGKAEVDARIDLHGMRQDRAFAALVAFLRRAQESGGKIVLVITGKGEDEGRGVLRRVVPAWLQRPELRDLVLGFEEASRRHGGSGALYVRLRRRRAAPRPPQPR
jgi:DNA-nicking Smr family endonuclease